MLEAYNTIEYKPFILPPDCTTRECGESGELGPCFRVTFKLMKSLIKDIHAPSCL